MIIASDFLKWLNIFKVPAGGRETVGIISSAVTLTAADLGKTFLVEGGPYTITMPAATAGINKFISFVFEPAVFGQLFTIAFPGGANITYGAGESVTYFTEGVNWLIYQQRFADQNYILGLSASINVSLNPVKWDTIVDSIGGGISYDNTTGRIKPLYQGWYEIDEQLTFSADPGGCFTATTVNATTTTFKKQTDSKKSTSAFSEVFCNGTTDFFTLDFTTTNVINVGGDIIQNFACIRRRSII